MKKCLLGFIVLGLTSGCATTPPPKGICYTPTGVANQVNDMHKVFGISLGQPLDLPECEKDQRMHDAGYTDYVLRSPFTKNPACYEKLIIERQAPDDCLPVMNDRVWAKFPYQATPYWAVDIGVSLVNGLVELVTIETPGHEAVAEVYASLISKYGKPTFKEEVEVQNLAGVKVKSVNATWKVDDVNVEFNGVLNKINFGKVRIYTNVVKSAEEKKHKAIKENMKSL